MSLWHNVNNLEVFNIFIKEGYSQDLLAIKYILDLFSLITCCHDFKDLYQTKYLFFYW